MGVSLYVVRAIAPLLVVAAVGLLLLAWRWPETVATFTARPQLARLPEGVRATPMRFAASVAVLVLVLLAVSLPVADALGGAASTPEPRAIADGASPTPEPTHDHATPRPTARPTPSSEADPTAAPTAAPTAPTRAPTPAAAPAIGQAPTGPTQRATVVHVTDGDTIRVLVDGQEFAVRYIGIDTPEIHSGVEWMGREAADANAALVANREVVLEKDVSETDRYGRLLRYVWLEQESGWLLVNLELLRRGFAQVTTYPPDVKYVEELYLPAQEAAREAGLGLWGAAPTPVPAAPGQPSNCEPSYPDFCLAIGTPDLDCGNVEWRRFTVLWNVPDPDPHRFDGNGDGVGCEG